MEGKRVHFGGMGEPYYINSLELPPHHFTDVQRQQVMATYLLVELLSPLR